jgi:hypothetical protein
MNRSRHRVPDGIEPISAYRAWRYAMDGNRAHLYPLTSGDLTGPGLWDTAGHRWIRASCTVDQGFLAELFAELERRGMLGSDEVVPLEVFSTCDPDDLPGERCSCGFYAVKAFWMLPPTADPRAWGEEDGGVILGRVGLAGKIVEHDLGYRAECARIAELNPIEGDESNAAVVAAAVGVALGPSVPSDRPPPGGSPPASSVPRRVGDWVQEIAS